MELGRGCTSWRDTGRKGGQAQSQGGPSLVMHDPSYDTKVLPCQIRRGVKVTSNYFSMMDKGHLKNSSIRDIKGVEYSEI